MKRAHLYAAVLVAVQFLWAPGVLAANTPVVSPSISSVSSASPVTTTSVVATPAPTPASPSLTQVPAVASDFQHTTKSIFWTKVWRFFSFSQSKEAELTDAIANSLLLKAQAQAQQGAATAATKTLTAYNTELNRLNQAAEKLSVTNNTQAASVLTQIETDEVAQYATTEFLAEDYTDLSSNLTQTQAKLLDQLAQSVSSGSNATQQQDKVNQVLTDYTKKVSDNTQQLAKKLLLAEKLKSVTKDPSVDQVIDDQENSDIAKAAEDLQGNDAQKLADLVHSQAELRSKEVGVLTKLLLKAPAAAQPGLQTALTQVVNHQLGDGQDVAAIQNLINSQADSPEVQDKLVNLLKESAPSSAAQQAAEEVKQNLENQREAAAQQAEAAKQQQEKIKEQQKQAVESHSQDQPDSATPTLSKTTSEPQKTESESSSPTPSAIHTSDHQEGN